ncbi:hypothetical protein BaRGS_00024706 [Batillaria attramentaria]|uniref:Uncharacterized protein n=1 Tax=Batillaria attramentaria TaxID=370345 RepID=A0ABD0KAJ8_9CAEN
MPVSSGKLGNNTSYIQCLFHQADTCRTSRENGLDINQPQNSDQLHDGVSYDDTHNVAAWKNFRVWFYMHECRVWQRAQLCTLPENLDLNRLQITRVLLTEVYEAANFIPPEKNISQAVDLFGKRMSVFLRCFVLYLPNTQSTPMDPDFAPFNNTCIASLVKTTSSCLLRPSCEMLSQKWRRFCSNTRLFTN